MIVLALTVALLVCVVTVATSLGRRALGRDAQTDEVWERTSPAAIAARRYRQLLELDIEPLTAAGAAMAGVDAAEVRALIDVGCTAGLALAILDRCDYSFDSR